MGAYIINVPSTVDRIIYVNVHPMDGKTYLASYSVDELTPCTAPDLEQVRQVRMEAYEQGRKDVETQFCSYDACKNRQEEYQRGLADAWEAAKKIALMDTETSENVTGYFGLFRIMENLTPMQAIEKIRQYEQEKRFCVGDEFEIESGKRFVIIKMDGTEVDRYIDEEGKTYCMNSKYKVMRKTGRHFPEIAAVLEKMRENK